MKRILVFCEREWNDPRAGSLEHYAHEVFRRVAQQGHYVAWVCRGRGNALVTPARSVLEQMDGIQVARLPLPFMYRRMAQLFLRRFSKTVGTGPRAVHGPARSTLSQFDAIVDCIDGRPLTIPENLDVPVVPVVHRLAPRVSASDEPPGPLVATNLAAREQLLQAGFPAKYIVLAPYGHDEPPAPARHTTSAEDTSPVHCIALERSPRRLLAAVRRVRSQGVPIVVDVVGGRRPAARGGDVRIELAVIGDVSAASVRANAPAGQSPTDAAFAYCGAGYEHYIPELAAHGVPVIAADTPGTRVFVRHEQTGVLIHRRSTSALADALRRVATDELLRKRLSANARESACPWDRTASLVLAAIEVLRPQGE